MIFFIVLSLLAIVTVGENGFPGSIGKGTDACTSYPCTDDSTFPDVSLRTSPLYPSKFTVHVQGYLVVPMTNENADDPHLVLKQDAEFLYSFEKNALAFQNKLQYGPLHFPNNMLHSGLNLYITEGPICFCIKFDVGILKYDAFKNSTYLGRYKKEIEFGLGTRLVDHFYMDGQHHIWVDVKTNTLIRFWQPTNGLQVYTNWRVNEVDEDVLELNPKCFLFSCKNKESIKLLIQDS